LFVFVLKFEAWSDYFFPYSSTIPLSSFSDNTSKSIVRYEFLESIVRLSLRKFPDANQVDAVRKTCEEYIIPTCKPEWDLDDFRRNYMYLEGCV